MLRFSLEEKIKQKIFLEFLEFKEWCGSWSVSPGFLSFDSQSICALQIKHNDKKH